MEDDVTDPTILFVKPKAISTNDKKALQAAGVIVVEVDDVANVKLVKANAELSGSALLVAASTVIGKSDCISQQFGRAVCAAIQAQVQP
jgi:hypothetical protein